MVRGSRERRSPLDRFTNASATAISSGFTAAMALGPQPRPPRAEPDQDPTQGADWLHCLQQASGIDTTGVNFSPTSSAEQLEEDIQDIEEDEDGDGVARVDAASSKGKRADKKSNSNRKTKSTTSTSQENLTAAQRKAQNRIAQREFRQRKQQYIRALEARVELLSSDHDTQVDRLRYALRGLLAENNQLRGVLASVTSFVGKEGLGGPLQKDGLTREELEDMIMGSSEQTMTRTWQNWPGAKECETLQRLRLESNLPPEGLPESQLYHSATDGTVSCESNALGIGSAPNLDEGRKRKADLDLPGRGTRPSRRQSQDPSRLYALPTPEVRSDPYGEDVGAGHIHDSRLAGNFAVSSPSRHEHFDRMPMATDAGALLASLFGAQCAQGHFGSRQAQVQQNGVVFSIPDYNTNA